MRKRMMAGACALAMVVAGQASAAVFVVSFKGTLQAPHTYDGSGQMIANPASALNPGDAVTVTYGINLYQGQDYTGQGYSTEANTGRFSGTVADVSFKIGTFDMGSGYFAEFATWNDKFISGTPRVDMTSLSFLGYFLNIPPYSQIPPINNISNYDLSFSAFDFSGAARNSTSFLQEPSLDLFATKALTLTFDLGNNRRTVYDIALSQASITAVPEPATWAMMIAGFGMAGAALRRRRVSLATA